jgi:hypothetical protein
VNAILINVILLLLHACQNMVKLDVRNFCYTGIADVNFICLFNDTVSSSDNRRIASSVRMVN